MQYEVVISHPCAISLSKYTLQWRWRLCIDLRWLDIWNACRVGQTVRTFALLFALELECVIIGVWSSMRSHPHALSKFITLQWQLRLCVDFRWLGHWMYRTAIVLTMDLQRVRLFIVACELELEGVVYVWRSMKSNNVNLMCYCAVCIRLMLQWQCVALFVRWINGGNGRV